MELFFVSASADYEAVFMAAVESLLPDSKRDRLLRCRSAQARTSMGAGELLLAYALMQQCAMRYVGSDRFEDENGKPCLKTIGSSIHFSISHSGEYAMVGIDREEVGVDIQQHVCVDEAVARKIMSGDAYQAWCLTPDKDLFFCEYWTYVESILKWKGVGLSGLNDAEEQLPEGVGVHAVAVAEGFSAAACGRGRVGIHHVPPDDLVRRWGR
mgnify:CR=1 FL=1